MNRKPEDRLERIVSGLLRGRRLKLRGGDAEDKEAIAAAARLAGARQGPQRMHPAFRKRLADSLEQTQSQGWLTRRAALVAGLGLAAGAAGGALLGRDLGPVTARAGGGTHVVAGGVGAFVFRHGDTVTAVSSVCSHLPCELWWESHAGALSCPCHPATFTPDGKPTEGYVLPALNKVHVRVTAAGRVEVLGTE